MTNPRLAAAIAWASLAGASSYALQRLYAAYAGEVHYADVIAQEHVPYTWRALIALFHAALVGLALGLGTRNGHAQAALKAVPAGVLVVVLLALSMVLVP